MELISMLILTLAALSVLLRLYRKNRYRTFSVDYVGFWQIPIGDFKHAHAVIFNSQNNNYYHYRQSAA